MLTLCKCRSDCSHKLASFSLSDFPRRQTSQPCGHEALRKKPEERDLRKASCTPSPTKRPEHRSAPNKQAANKKPSASSETLQSKDANPNLCRGGTTTHRTAHSFDPNTSPNSADASPSPAQDSAAHGHKLAEHRNWSPKQRRVHELKVDLMAQMPLFCLHL